MAFSLRYILHLEDYMSTLQGIISKLVPQTGSFGVIYVADPMSLVYV